MRKTSVDIDDFLLDAAGFDALRIGRPSLAPGRYFRLLIGIFRGTGLGVKDGAPAGASRASNSGFLPAPSASTLARPAARHATRLPFPPTASYCIA